MKKDKEKRRSSLTFGEKMLFIAGILLCLVLITTAMMGGLFARYTTTGTGQDRARVARFGDLTVEEDGDFVDFKAMIIPGVDLKKDVKISFSASEVAVYVFAEVQSNDWIRNGDRQFRYPESGDACISWTVDGQWNLLEGTQSVYYRELSPSTETTQMNFLALEDQEKGTHISVSDAITKEQLAQMREDRVNLNIVFKTSAIQAGSFADAAEAWNYLNP